MYRNESGSELRFAVRDEQLTGVAAAQPPFALEAMGAFEFRVSDSPGVTLVFLREGDRVVAVLVEQGREEAKWKCVEEKQP